jgi:hypothetical protein
MSQPNQPPAYPAVRFLVTKGDFLAVLVGLVPLGLGLWALSAGYPWPLALLGAAAGAVLWLVLRSYVEVLRILSDTLMPR